MGIILASASPRRREILRRAGLTDFTVLPVEADESWDEEMTPEEVVASISRKKALAARPLVQPEDLVITADTMVFLDGLRLGKPHSGEEAVWMLRRLSGRAHTVWTGVTVSQGERMETEAEATTVRFLPLSEETIRRYVATGEPMDKAGAYGLQDRGSILVEGLEGDCFNVMGLPVARLNRMLHRFGAGLL